MTDSKTQADATESPSGDKKLKMHTPDFTEANIARLAELFPNCITETRDEATGQLKRTIDFDQLRQELSDHVVDGPRERYHLNWPGKREALLAANAPIAKTLRPSREESVDFDTTKNLFIEGDNLDALKLMQETYLNKVKMIYIDPPYNTGNDFVYEDDFVEGFKDYLLKSNQIDGGGVRLQANTEANGRFHSDWLSMMMPRLRVARHLLREDGFIVLSVDEHEVHTLRLLLDEVFGQSNFLGQLVRATGTTTSQDAGGFGQSFDYILVYRKSSAASLSGLPLSKKDESRFSRSDEKGKYSLLQMRKTGNNDRREDRPNLFFGVVAPDGSEVYPVGPGGYDSCWRFGQSTYEEMCQKDVIEWQRTKRGNEEVWAPYVKYYLEGRTKRPSLLWNDIEGSKKASRDLRKLMGDKVFSNPKPLEMLERILHICLGSETESLVLDFFAGSCSLAHAV